MNTPTNEINKCPNPECPHDAPIRPLEVKTVGHQVFCDACFYRGPAATTPENAVRLHNVICRPAPANLDTNEAAYALVRELGDELGVISTEKDWERVIEIARKHFSPLSPQPAEAPVVPGAEAAAREIAAEVWSRIHHLYGVPADSLPVAWIAEQALAIISKHTQGYKVAEEITFEWVDTNIVQFDDTVIMGKSYDFFGLENLRREAHTPHGSFVIWPDRLGEKTYWSLYCTNGGIMAFHSYTTENQAKVDAEIIYRSLASVPAPSVGPEVGVSHDDAIMAYLEGCIRDLRLRKALAASPKARDKHE